MHAFVKGGPLLIPGLWISSMALCSLFQKQVCIDWSKSDPSDSISILWKTNSEVCLVFMSSVVATRCKSKTPCHSTSPAPQPLCLSLLPPCLAHQAEVSYSQDNLLCRIDLDRNNKNQKQKSKGKPWLCSYIIDKERTLKYVFFSSIFQQIFAGQPALPHWGSGSGAGQGRRGRGDIAKC